MSGDVKRSVHAEPVRTGYLEGGEREQVRMVDTAHPLPVVLPGQSEIDPATGELLPITLDTPVTGPELRSLAQDVGEIKTLLKRFDVYLSEMTGITLGCGDTDVSRL